MKVMSFNVLCGGPEEKDFERRKNLVPEIIKKYKPDSIGLQEAHINWINTINAALPEYDYVGIGRNDCKTEGEFAAVYYLKDKFELIDSGNFWLSETPTVPGKGWDAVCIRICTFAVLKEKESGKVFAHFNTHLDHKGQIAIKEGAKLICKKMQEYNNIPTVLTGDFNAYSTSEAYKCVIESGFKDTRKSACISDEMYTFHAYDKFYSDDYKKIIDYIFVRDEKQTNYFKTITDDVNGILPSDHFPIVADIDL